MIRKAPSRQNSAAPALHLAGGSQITLQLRRCGNHEQDHQCRIHRQSELREDHAFQCIYRRKPKGGELAGRYSGEEGGEGCLRRPGVQVN